VPSNPVVIGGFVAEEIVRKRAVFRVWRYYGEAVFLWVSWFFSENQKS